MTTNPELLTSLIARLDEMQPDPSEGDDLYMRGYKRALGTIRAWADEQAATTEQERS